jgi:hypothetical protein
MEIIILSITSHPGKATAYDQGVNIDSNFSLDMQVMFMQDRARQTNLPAGAQIGSEIGGGS